jgi:flagellar hook-length control protein FliK
MPAAAKTKAASADSTAETADDATVAAAPVVPTPVAAPAPVTTELDLDVAVADAGDAAAAATAATAEAATPAPAAAATAAPAPAPTPKAPAGQAGPEPLLDAVDDVLRGASKAAPTAAATAPSAPVDTPSAGEPARTSFADALKSTDAATAPPAPPPEAAGKADAAAAPAAARAAVAGPAVVSQVAVHITRAVEDSAHHFTVDLKPPTLGSITIELQIGHDHRVNAVIAAERPETLDLLQRDSRALERAVQDAGLRTDSGSLNFGLKGEGDRQGAFAGQQTFVDRFATDDADADDAPVVAPPATARSLIGGLDIRV